jgi:zinc protease
MLARSLLALLALLALAAHAVPPIGTWETGNGARVLFIEARELPIVDATVVFDAAGARDGDRPGLALATNALLAEGAGGLSADAIAQRFAELGARFAAESHRDMATAELRTLSEAPTLAAAAELTATVLGRPDFPADALERVRRQILVSLQQVEQSPDELAERAFYRTLYGEHPYAEMPEGTVESVSALGRDDVRGFHARHYVGRNAVVAIVGDLDRAGAERLAETLVGRLPPGEPAPAIPSPSPSRGAVERVIEHPSAQTHLVVGDLGISRLDPDYFPLHLGNHALGGSGLVSVLGEEVREKRGLSYSVSSAFVPMRVEGPFILGLQTRNEQAAEALKVARDVLRRFVEEGPTEAELEAARKNLTGGFALRLDSNKKLVGQLASMGFYRLPLDYLETYTARVEAVSRDEVREAFRRRLDPGRLVTVLVGKPDGTTPGLASAPPPAPQALEAKGAD